MNLLQKIGQALHLQGIIGEDEQDLDAHIRQVVREELKTASEPLQSGNTKETASEPLQSDDTKVTA